MTHLRDTLLLDIYYLLHILVGPSFRFEDGYKTYIRPFIIVKEEVNVYSVTVLEDEFDYWVRLHSSF